MDTIGERIRRTREAATPKISRRKLAESAGIAYTTLSDLELGESKSTTALHRIAEKLGVNSHWLETGQGERAAFKTTEAASPMGASEPTLSELRVAQLLLAQSLAESIPTAGRALVDRLTHLAPDARKREHFQLLVAMLRQELAKQDAAALRAPARKSPGRKRP